MKGFPEPTCYICGRSRSPGGGVICPTGCWTNFMGHNVRILDAVKDPNSGYGTHGQRCSTDGAGMSSSSRSNPASTVGKEGADELSPCLASPNPSSRSSSSRIRTTSISHARQGRHEKELESGLLEHIRKFYWSSAWGSRSWAASTR